MNIQWKSVKSDYASGGYEWQAIIDGEPSKWFLEKGRLRGSWDLKHRIPGRRNQKAHFVRSSLEIAKSAAARFIESQPRI